jgi:hypothetical protein
MLPDPPDKPAKTGDDEIGRLGFGAKRACGIGQTT